MKIMRKIVKIDEELCDGCGQCVPACAEGAIELVNGKARLVAEKYCDGLGACLGECPNDAIKVIEREADDFDEKAVETYLSAKQKIQPPAPEILACGCPSSQVQTFIPDAPGHDLHAHADGPKTGSALSHWPVQINLVPANAPFLKGADLLIAADCTPVAYPHFHQDFLKGRVVMTGCPKFDDVEGYIQKFTDIFKTAHIKSITCLIMEVPCCSGMPVIVKRALEAAGKQIPLQEVVISNRGDVKR
jgi:NAD-dependent dihydropyrimidine dehydrogenase PreA subunit